MSNLKKLIIEKINTSHLIWFMRQAGRYLPEFREIRSKNTNFINLCLNSDLSSQITLQPIARYDLDSAIIFSDILLVPYALGQEVKFVKDHGPELSKFNLEKFLDNNEINFTKKLNPVYEAISKTRKKLDKKKSLISFIGAPWTLLMYMLNLKKREKNNTHINTNDIDLSVEKIFKNLNKYLCLHVENQINAGADLVQIFDSWAGLLDKDKLDNFCLRPNLEIVDFCKLKKIPVICFPKGIKEKYKDFNNKVKPDGINIDYEVDPSWVKKNLSNVVIQGGMNPRILLESKETIFREAKKYLYTFKNVPYIFNLGHGLIPETDPDKLGALIKFVRGFK